MSIGIMGGTFNPIHIGHLIIGECAREKFQLNKVIYIPTGEPPHKTSNLTKAEVRYRLVELAVRDNPYFEASSIETYRPGTTYTVDTITELEKMYPGEEFYYIIGTDTLFSLETWKDVQFLAGRVTFVVYDRQSKRDAKVLEKSQYLKEKYNFKFEYCDGPRFDFSSTLARKLLGIGFSARYIIPEAITSLIDEIQIEPELDFRPVIKFVKSKLGSERLLHTYGVVEVAEEMASIYGVDANKAITAAFLHDAAKPLTHTQMLIRAKELSLSVDEDTLNDPNLLHGPLAAEMAKNDLGIVDEDILNAISFHTTGRAGMSTLEKIIYMADLTEQGRDFAGVQRLREQLSADLDLAMFSAIEETIKYLQGKNHKIHINTLNARDDLILKINKK